MDENQIVVLASEMNNRDDLFKLLNIIKEEYIAKNSKSGKFYPFEEKHIKYYCNPNNVFHRYIEFEIQKRSGGVRTITAPRNDSFRYLLICVNELLKSLYTPSDYAMGFAEGRSVVTNANCHVGQNYIFNIDLKDFFPSIDQARVWKRLQLKPFNFSVEVANVLAGICAMRVSCESDNEEKKYKYVLPQGSPVSPIITNMICDKLDRRLAGLAKRFGLIFSRYADDITFSSKHNVYQKNGDFMVELKRIITDQGFTINEAKTRLQKRGDRQEVTGIIVSDKINVTQKYIRDIRNILYIWDRYGENEAFRKFYPKYIKEKGHVKKGMPSIRNVIDGKLMYLKMIKGVDDNVFIRLYSKFIKLAKGIDYDEYMRRKIFKASDYNVVSHEDVNLFGDEESNIKSEDLKNDVTELDEIDILNRELDALIDSVF